MKLTASAALSQEQKRQAKELASLCRSHDGSSLSFPLEDGEFFVLICEENVLACALGFCRMEPISWRSPPSPGQSFAARASSRGPWPAGRAISPTTTSPL